MTDQSSLSESTQILAGRGKLRNKDIVAQQLESLKPLDPEIIDLVARTCQQIGVAEGLMRKSCFVVDASFGGLKWLADSMRIALPDGTPLLERPLRDRLLLAKDIDGLMLSAQEAAREFFGLPKKVEK